MSRNSNTGSGLPKPKIVTAIATNVVMQPNSNNTVGQSTTTTTQVSQCRARAAASRGQQMAPGGGAPARKRSGLQIPVPNLIGRTPPVRQGRDGGCAARQSTSGLPLANSTMAPPSQLPGPVQRTPMTQGPATSTPFSGLRPPQIGSRSSGLQMPGFSSGRGMSTPQPSQVPPQITPSPVPRSCRPGSFLQAPGFARTPGTSGNISGIEALPVTPEPPSGLQAPGFSRTSGPAGGDPRRQIPQPTSIQPRTLRTPQAPTKKQPLEQEVHEQLLQQLAQNPDEKVVAKGVRKTRACPETMVTAAGSERVLQRAVFERRVERDETGQRVVKNLTITDLDDKQKGVDKVTLSIQQLDPHYIKKDGKEAIGITSTLSITPSYKTVSKECVRVATEPTDGGVTLAPEEVAQMVEEEKEDVENTLKMVPPDLVLSPGKYRMKKRLQKLRLNSESMALLEQSIIQPEATADEAQSEPTPEVMATMMHTVETGITPQSAPDQVFNTLFEETANEQFIKLSSVSPGPLQDVVVPSEIDKDVHKEVLTDDMDKLAEKLASTPQADEIPYVDVFTRVMDDAKKSPEKGKNNPRSFQMITDEKSLWVNANLEPLVHLVGAEPVEVLDPWNLDALERSGNLEQELANGIEFFLDTNPLQYMSRVQLRGTQHPSYFPGYMVALPDFPDVVKIARSPDEVFASAWKSVQPKYFDEDSTQSLLV